MKIMLCKIFLSDLIISSGEHCAPSAIFIFAAHDLLSFGQYDRYGNKEKGGKYK